MALRRTVARIAWFPTCALIRTVFRALGGFRVEGRDRVPARGRVVICPNHTCDVDAPAVAAALPRYARFMAKEDLFAMRFVGGLLRLFDVFPVRRNSADRAALRTAVRTLEEGEALVIFPEGGGNPDGRLHPLHPGALMVALQTDSPVVPCAIHDAQRFLPYGATRPRRSERPLRIVFGEPLDLSDLKGRRDATTEATARLARALADLLGQPVPEGKPILRD
ncbi:MAG: lysophospholipid acyltransferase family protein [Armatimonadota bacterium]